jgi:hypothetical protein
MLTHKFALLEDEKLRNIYRQSNLFIIKYVIYAGIIILLPTYLLWRYGLLSSYKGVIYILLIAAGLWLLREALIWYRNNYVITNQRLLLFEHDGLFKHTVIETPLERILNVSYKTTGVMSALWGYGDVEVQVVGLVEPVILKHIPDPEYIKDYLWQMHKRVTTKPITFQAQDIAHSQEQIGYTKHKQKIL